jgi:hypothetical protein
MKEKLRAGLGSLKAHWKLAVAVVCLVLVVGTGAFAYSVGIVGLERHRGFFAPVWSDDGKKVYFVERVTRGFIWGLGWEHFTPPASAYVLSDQIGLRRVDEWGNAIENLADFQGSPVEGRTTKHYRGRIFNTMTARLNPSAGGLDFRVRMNIPKVPRSEQWALTGLWPSNQSSPAPQWRQKWAGNMSAGEAVLKNGIELIAIKGQESYPAAILAVNADGSYRVLVKNKRFRSLYPNGVPRRLIAQVSRRKGIDRSQQLRRVQGELMAKYKAEGKNEGAAALATLDDMERLGHLQRSPRLVATLVDRVPKGVRVFDIPAQRFQVGLYQDIARAMARPGAEVKTGTGTYLKYADDNTGPELKAYRQAGNDRFAVRSGAKLYLLQVRRFKK